MEDKKDRKCERIKEEEKKARLAIASEKKKGIKETKQG